MKIIRQGLLILVLLAIGIVFLFTAWQGYQNYDEKKEFSQLATGRITEKFVDESSGADAVYKVRYDFVLKNGESVKGEEELLKNHWDAVKIGDMLDIRYQPEKPQRNHVYHPAGDSPVFAFFMFLVGAVFIFFALMRVIYFFKSPSHT